MQVKGLYPRNKDTQLLQLLFWPTQTYSYMYRDPYSQPSHWLQSCMDNIKITPKVFLWTSEVLLNHKIFSKILIWFYRVHFTRVLITSHPTFRIMENNMHLLYGMKLLVWCHLSFDGADRRPSFHVVNCWYVSICEELHSWVISRKRDSIH